MNSVYESLRALLRQKELEIKKLEKEIEALRIVLPIVAEAGPIALEGEAATAVAATVAKFAAEPNKTKSYTPPAHSAEFDNIMAQAASAAASGTTTTPNIPAPDLTPKPRTNWP